MPIHFINFWVKTELKQKTSLSPYFRSILQMYLFSVFVYKSQL
jgi:hypothetical protein